MKTKMYLFVGFIMFGIIIYLYDLQSLNTSEPPSFEEKIGIIFLCSLFLCSLVLFMPSSKKKRQWRITVRLIIAMACIGVVLLLWINYPNSNPFIVFPIFIPALVLSFLNFKRRKVLN